VNKIIPRGTGLFIFFLILLPVPGYTQAGGNAAEELKRALESRGISYEEAPLFSPPGEGRTGGIPNAGTSVLVSFRRPPGVDPRDPGGARVPSGSGPEQPVQAELYAGFPSLFVTAFPLEGPPGREGELAYRFKAALELIEKIRAGVTAGEPLPMDMIIAFLGDGDFHTAGEYRNRSALEFADYGDIIEDPGKTVFWYLDPGNSPQSLITEYGTSETIAPLHIIQDLPGLCRSLDIPCFFAVPFTELYKLHFAGGPELLRFIQGQEINGLYFSGVEDPGSASAIPEGSLAELVIRYAGSLKNPGEIPDYHYSAVFLPGMALFLSQERIVLLFLLIAGSFFPGFLCYMGFRRPPPARFMLFFRCFWILPAFFLLFVFCFAGAGVCTALFFTAGEETGLSLIYGWAGFKLLFALGLFFLLSLPLSGYRIPRKANFYGTGAFLIVILGAFIAAWADIAFIPFFIGALLVIFLGMIIKFAIPVFFCAFFAPFYGILTLIFAINSGNSALGEFFLSPRLSHSFIIALIFLPFILLFKRGLKLVRKGKPALPLRFGLVPPLVLLTAAGLLACFFVFTR
jgi:hypothetical protein